MEAFYISSTFQLTVKNFPGYDLLQLNPFKIIIPFEVDLASVNVTTALKRQ
jgi:hypothetical protein